MKSMIAAVFTLCFFAVLTTQVTGQPVINITPDSLFESLQVGDTSVQTITVYNLGTAELQYGILFEGIISTAASTGVDIQLRRVPQATEPERNLLDAYKQYEALGIQIDPFVGQVDSKSLEVNSYSAALNVANIDSFVIFFDDMESGLNGWSHYSTHSNGIDQWHQTTNRSNSGAVSWRVSQHDSYGSDALESPEIDLFQFQSALLSFYHWYNFDDCESPSFDPDGGIVEVTTDGGLSWTQIFPLSGYPYVLDDICDNPLAFFEAYAHDGGVGNDFIPAFFDLTSFTGEVISIRFHAGWDCGNCSGNEGWFIDDVTVSSENFVSWLSASPDSGIIAPGDSAKIAVTFDATNLFGGVHLANMIVNSNDSVNPKALVPVTLDVTGIPAISVSDTSIDFGAIFIGLTETDTLTISNNGTDELVISSISSDNPDFTSSVSALSLAPTTSTNVILTFMPTTVAVITGNLTIASNDTANSVVTVALRGEGLSPPDIAVSPDSLVEDLFTGESSMQQLTISNTAGGSDLLWEITTAFAGMTTSVISSPIFGSQANEQNNKDTTETSLERPNSAEIYTFEVAGGIDSTTPPSAATNPTSLETILDSLNSGIAAVTGIIPNRYDFSDGVFGNSISDGGNDMYDGGNFLSTDMGGPLSYSDNVILNSAVFGGGGRYFTRKYPGLFVMAADMQGLNFFQITGNLGADGGGNVDGAILETTLNGITYRGFVKRVYNTSDPSVNHLIIVEEDPAVTHEFSTNTDNDYHRVFNLTGVTRIYYLLYAGANGFYLDNNVTLNIMNTFINTLGLQPTWVIASPNSGTIPAGNTQIVDVTFDATGLNGGDYFADILISSNDPDESEVVVPTHLHVTGAPDIAVSPDSLDYGSLFIGASAIDTVVVKNIGTDLLVVSDVSSDNADFVPDTISFTLVPEAEIEILVTFAPSVAGPIGGLLTFTSNDPDMPSATVVLRGQGLIPPDIAVSPDSLDEDLFTGETSIQLLTVTNSGGSDLFVDLSTKLISGGSASPSFTLELDLQNRLMANYESNPDKQTIDMNSSAGQKFMSTANYSSSGFQDTTSDNPVLAGLYTGDHLRFGLSDYGEIMPFQFPVGNEHLQLGTFLSGYTIAYFVSGVDNIAWAASFSQNRILPVSYTELVNDSAEVVVRVVTKTDDDLIYLTRTFTFDRQDKFVNIQTNIENVSGIPVTDVVFKSYADWDTDGTFFGNWDYDLSRNMVYSWLTNYTAIATSRVPDLMDINGWDDFARRVTFVDYPTGPVIGFDGLEVLHFNLGDLASGSSTELETVYGAGSSLDELQSVIDRGIGFVNWLSVNPETAVIPPGASLDFEIMFDATGLNGGDYFADILISSNDPDEPEVVVPTHLHVTGAPDITVAPDSLDYGTLFIGASATDTVVVKNTGTDLLVVSNVSSDNADFVPDTTSFTLVPGAEIEILVTFAPSVAGSISGLLTLFSNDPDMSSVTVVLRGQGLVPPDIAVSPDSLEADLFTGEMSVNTLTISNTGLSDLTFEIFIEGVSTTKQSTGPRILLLPADLVSYSLDVRSKLLATGVFSIVDTMNVRIATPTLVQLMEYDAVLTWSDLSYFDPVALGNVLADYVDGGGGVVVALLGMYQSSSQLIQGRFNTQNYWAIQPADFQLGPQATLGTIHVPGHPTIQDVNTFDGGTFSVRTNGGTINPSATLIASWSDGEPLIAVRAITGTNRVDLGMFPPSSDVASPFFWVSTTDGAIIMANALNYVAGPNFVAISPTSGTIPAGSSIDVEVTFDATGLNGGDYLADLFVKSNDPDEPEVRVPVHLHVTGAPDIVVAPDSLDYGTLFIGASATDTVVVENIGTDLLVVSNVSSDNADFVPDTTSFSLNPGEETEIVITFAPSVGAPIAGLLTITSNDPDMPIITVVLQGQGLIPPEIDVDPVAFTADLLLTVNPEQEDTLTISNRGGSDLNWQIFLSLDNASNQILYTLNIPASTNDPSNFEETSVFQEFILSNARTVPITEYLDDLTGVNVLFDEYHLGFGLSANWSTLISDLRTRGAIVTVNSSPITSTVLEDMDVVWALDMHSVLWTTPEINALNNWLVSGGGLLIESDQFVTQYNNILTTLGSGILYSSGGAAGITTSISPHQTTIGVDSIYLGGPLAQLSTVTFPAALLINDFLGTANTAFSRVGSGRIVVMADENFGNFSIGVADNQLFGNQVFDWLASTIDLISVSSQSGTTVAGSSTSLLVTIDGTGLQSGDYSVILSIESNDPITPKVELPVDIHVLEFLCGDANSDGVVDQFDLEYLFQTYFYNGPATISANSTDLNCNNKIDLADIIILSKYLNGSITIDCCNGSLFSKQSVSLEIMMRQQSSSLLK